MKLTATAVKTAKPKEKPYKLFDGHGLYLEIRPTGSKRWRYKYTFNGKEKLISLGTYPLTSLKEARDKHFEARKLLDNGINPSEARKEQKEAKSASNSFQFVAEEWWKQTKHTWSEKHGEQVYRRLEKNLFPWLRNTPVSDITPPELLKHLRRMEERGAVEMAHRVKTTCGQIFRYAISTGRLERDITQDLKDALKPVTKKHFPTITDPTKIGELLRAIDGYEGHPVTKCALKLAPLTFVRPGELRHMEWEEIDFERKEWVIPPEKMKMKAKHVVPLSTQAIAVLEEIKPLTGRGKYVFPSVRSSSRPLSDNGVNSALRRMGYTKDEIVPHSFRSMASTLLNEQGYKWDAIERQLAHSERNSVRAAYNYAEYMDIRIPMMQQWADYLDELKSNIPQSR